MRFSFQTAILAAALCALAAFPGAARAQNALTVLTEEFPPYNFTENGQLRGISTDVLRLVLEDSGIRAGGEIQVLPWARAYSYAQAHRGALLFSVTRTREREALFKWVGPVAPNRNALIARKGRGIHLASAAEIFSYRIGAIRDDAGAQLLLAMGYANRDLDVSPDALSNLLKLESGRIDLFAYPEAVFRWVAARNGRNPDDYETAFVLHEGHVYFALNKDTPDEAVARLQHSLDKLKAEGRVQAVIDSYLR